MDGQEFIALNGGPQFKFSPAISFVVNCETQEEIDVLWEKLSQGGTNLQCGWLQDKFGVSWQIVPTALAKLMSDPDREKTSRVMQALMQMTKIDIQRLQEAFQRGVNEGGAGFSLCGHSLRGPKPHKLRAMRY